MLPSRVLVTHSDPLTQAGLSSALAACAEFEVLARSSAAPAGRIDVLVADYVSALGYLGRQPSAGPAASVARPPGAGECPRPTGERQRARGVNST